MPKSGGIYYYEIQVLSKGREGYAQSQAMSAADEA
jgi:hypothetical protein